MKFNDILTQTAKEIRAQRAIIISDNAKDAAEEVLRSLSKKKREIEAKLLDLTDFSRDSEFSLKVVKADFDATSWFKNIVNLRTNLLSTTLLCEVAEDTYKEWFGDEEKEAPKIKTKELPKVRGFKKHSSEQDKKTIAKMTQEEDKI